MSQQNRTSRACGHLRPPVQNAQTMTGTQDSMQAAHSGQSAHNAAFKATLARAWPWVLLLLAAIGFGLYGRFGLIQSTPIGLMCQSAEPAWFCTPRHWLWLIGNIGGWSWAAMLG